MTHPLKWLALVALDRPELPPPERLRGWYAERFPEAAPLKPASSTENFHAMTIGEFTAAVTLVPRPIPWSQLEGPAATAWYWPEAASRLRDHSAHLLITLIDEGGPAVAKATALTRLAAAAAATSPSAGVFWGPGRLVHPVNAFVDQSNDIGEVDLPLFLWIDFRVEPLEGESGLRAFTTGLEALGEHEIEVRRFDGTAQALIGHFYNLAHYLLGRKKVVGDGDTVGLAEGVSVIVRRERSMLDPNLEVLQLEFEADQDGDRGGQPAT